VDEVLRFDPPVQLTQRIAHRDVEEYGQRLRPDTVVLVLLASANRDPEVFDEPDRFDVRRGRSHDTLAFGSGIHFCLGALLARLEGEVAFEALTRYLPELRLTRPPERGESPVVRGLRRLPVRARPDGGRRAAV